MTDKATYALELNLGSNEGYDHSALGPIDLTPTEVALLEKEVDAYNQHVADLTEGRAPVASYVNPNTKYDRWLLYSKIPLPKLEEAGYKLTGEGEKKEIDVSFRVVRVIYDEYHEGPAEVEDEIVYGPEGFVDETDPEGLRELLTKPYDDSYNDDTLGYGILPMTETIIDIMEQQQLEKGLKNVSTSSRRESILPAYKNGDMPQKPNITRSRSPQRIDLL